MEALTHLNDSNIYSDGKGREIAVVRNQDSQIKESAILAIGAIRDLQQDYLRCFVPPLEMRHLPQRSQASKHHPFQATDRRNQ